MTDQLLVTAHIPGSRVVYRLPRKRCQPRIIDPQDHPQRLPVLCGQRGGSPVCSANLAAARQRGKQGLADLTDRPLPLRQHPRAKTAEDSTADCTSGNRASSAPVASSATADASSAGECTTLTWNVRGTLPGPMATSRTADSSSAPEPGGALSVTTTHTLPPFPTVFLPCARSPQARQLCSCSP